MLAERQIAEKEAMMAAEKNFILIIFDLKKIMFLKLKFEYY
jgi:hypothetical protein